MSILQYADDTILLIEDNLEYERNLKFILCIFEQFSFLKINFHKSELYYLGKAVERKEECGEIVTCTFGQIPFRYLGIPIDNKRLSKKHWKPTEDKVEKRLACWQGKLLYIGGD